MEVLQWARTHGCQWDDITCSEAALGGHLAVIQWARAQNCPWSFGDCVGQPEVDICNCCYGPERKAAPGTDGRVP